MVCAVNVLHACRHHYSPLRITQWHVKSINKKKRISRKTINRHQPKISLRCTVLKGTDAKSACTRLQAGLPGVGKLQAAISRFLGGDLTGERSQSRLRLSRWGEMHIAGERPRNTTDTSQTAPYFSYFGGRLFAPLPYDERVVPSTSSK